MPGADLGFAHFTSFAVDAIFINMDSRVLAREISGGGCAMYDVDNNPVLLLGLVRHLHRNHLSDLCPPSFINVIYQLVEPA